MREKKLLHDYDNHLNHDDHLDHDDHLNYDDHLNHDNNLDRDDHLDHEDHCIWKEVGGVHKEVGCCLISYNIQLACVRKLEVI